MHPTRKRRDREVVNYPVTYRGEDARAIAVVIWGRQSPHVSYDSPRAFDQPIPTVVRRLYLKSLDHEEFHPTPREYREVRRYVLARALALKAGVSA